MASLHRRLWEGTGFGLKHAYLKVLQVPLSQGPEKGRGLGEGGGGHSGLLLQEGP